MAAPGHRLRAHDRRGLALSEGDQPIERGREGRRLHVVRVAAEALVPPPEVGRVGLGFAQPAQVRDVRVDDAVRHEFFGEPGAIEVRMARGARHGAHVGEVAHAVLEEQRDERFKRTRGVPDGEDGGRVSP
jgi:hypothetical protein